MLSSKTNLQRFGAVATLVGGMVASTLLFLTLRRWETAAVQGAVQVAALQRLDVLRESLSNSLESLHAVASLYNSGSPVDRTRFRRFAEDAFSRHPELQALSWTPRVPAAERSAWEGAARAEGLADFHFTELDPRSGQMVPARPNPQGYYPVYFIEPMDRNRAALGFDLNARLATLALARDQGAASATPPVRLMQDAGDDLGFVVYLPLYQAGHTPATVRERAATNIGFVGAVFRIADLVRPALAFQPGLRVTLRDAEAGPAVFTVANQQAGPAAAGLQPCTLALSFAGRTWLITFAPTTEFAAQHPRHQSWAALAAGLLVTSLLTFYLLADSKRDAEVARVNRDLQAEVVERKRAEENAAAASRAKSDFLTSLSHEIRTPLNAILGYTQILERDPDLPERYEDAVGALGNSGRHLLGLLNSILDLAKIEAGRMEVQREVFDVTAFVQGIAEMFKPRCREKQLRLRVVCAPDLPAAVRGDEGKLRQVLINLIGNGIKFTPHGEVYLGVQCPAPGRCRFEVIDTGIGLQPAELDQLFTPFFQTHTGRTLGGTGLGLAIAQGHVELMGGRLMVQSESGVGTRFSFELPLEPAEPPAMAATVAMHLAPGIIVRALVVDDNRDNRLILTHLLTDLGCAVADAATAHEAQAIARQAAPDILFIDVRLGDTTGPELWSELVAAGLSPLVPTVFHTAAMMDRAQCEHLRADGAELLAKPFRVEDLCSCLRRVPGVRFDDAPPVPPEALPWSETDLEQLAVPAELCARMVMAAELHSTTVLKTCFEELRQLGGLAPALADHLRLLLRAYDLVAIARLLNRLRVQPTPAAP